MFLPEEDRYSRSRRAIISSICSLFGGRIAEQLTLGDDGVTTGAQNDIQRATEIARNMVTKWGLSESMGPLLYDESDEEVFLGRSAAMHSKTVSGETARQIDVEVRRIIDECYGSARSLLEDNIDTLHMMADALMQYETIDADQINDIMNGKPPQPPAGWDDMDDDPGDRGSEPDKAADDPKGPIGGAVGEH
jgi:cell division protease FtsH